MNDPFEQRLSKIPRREVPAGWREEILAGAGGREIPRREVALPQLWAALRGLLHPYAWACLVVLWLAIAALHFSGPREEELYATSASDRKTSEASAERYAAYFRLQQRILAFNADANGTAYWWNDKKL